MEETDKKTSFVLYTENYNAIKFLSVEDAGTLFLSLFRKFNNEEGFDPSSLPVQVKVLYEMLIMQIERDLQKFEKKKEERKERNKRYRANLSNRLKTCETYNENVNENENENENVNENVLIEETKDKSFAPAVEGDCKGEQQQQQQQQLDFFPLENGLVMKRSSFLKGFNACVRSSKIPEVRRMTDERWAAAVEMMQKFSMAEITEGLRRAALSPAMNGRTKLKFIANYDWLMQPDNFLKVLEGNFKTRD